MQIKVCGMREPQNIEELLGLPIDYVGFIFYPKSKRFVGQSELQSWLENGGGNWEGKQRVGVFVNASIDLVLNALHDYQLDYIQFHGTESPEYLRELQLLWQASSVRKAKMVKAFSIDADFDFNDTAAYAPYCSFFIFDTKGDGYGGTGEQFDWSLLDDYQGVTPFLLSGGIHEDSAAVGGGLALVGAGVVGEEQAVAGELPVED